MSAFLCSESTLNLIANAYTRDPIEGAQAFETLLLQNIRSLRACYAFYREAGQPQRDLAERAAAYRFRAIAPEALVREAYVAALAEAEQADDKAAARAMLPSCAHAYVSVERLAAQINKAATCYAYQACETSDWPGSRARQIADDVKTRAGEVDPNLYAEAFWDFAPFN